MSLSTTYVHTSIKYLQGWGLHHFLGQPVPKSPSMKKFFLISNLHLPWCNWRLFPHILSLVIWEERPTPAAASLQVVVESCREHVKILKKPGGIAHTFWGIDKRQAAICLYYPGVKALLHIRMGSTIFLQLLLAGWILTFSFLICQYMPLTSTIQLILSYTVSISTAQGLRQERRQGE